MQQSRENRRGEFVVVPRNPSMAIINGNLTLQPGGSSIPVSDIAVNPTLSISSSTLSISPGGSSVVLPTGTNPTLSLVGTTLSVNPGGSSVTLPSGGGITPAGATYGFNGTIVWGAPDGTLPLVRGYTPSTSNALSNGMTYSSSTGLFSPTSGNTGWYFVSCSLNWVSNDPLLQPIFQLKNGTTIPAPTVFSQTNPMSPIAYDTTTINYLDDTGHPISQGIATDSYGGNFGNATLTGLVNLSSTSNRFGLYANTVPNSLTVRFVNFTMFRIA